MLKRPSISVLPRGLAGSLALVAVLGPAGIDMYLASMPAMANELQASYANVQLSLTFFLLALGAGQLFWGPLTDMLGRRRPLLAGIIFYIIAAVWATQANSLTTLLFARVVQGLAAGLTLVVVMSMVRDVTEGVQAAKLFALLMTIVGLAPVLAPAIGGGLDSLYGWRAVMLALAALGAVALLNSVAFLRETLPLDRRTLPNDAMRSYLRIASDRAFLFPALALAASFFFLFAYISGASLVYQRDFSLQADSFGMVFGATGIAVLIGAMCCGTLVGRYGITRLSLIGTGAMMAGSMLSLAGALTGWGLVGVLSGMFLSLFGLGIAEATLMSMAMGSQQRALGSTAALLGAIQMTVASSATPLAAILAQFGPIPWLAFLACAGVLVLCLAFANARINSESTVQLAH